MNLPACGSLTLSPQTGTWYRAINARFWGSFLVTGHTRTIPGRFNAGNTARPGFEILYLAEDPLVALFEVQGLLGSPYPPGVYVPSPSGAWLTLNVHIVLQSVADLTVVSQRRSIATTVQELTGDWRGYLLRNPTPRLTAPFWTNVPTQRLGHALHTVRALEGFVTYSSRVPTKKNLVIFPGKLRTGSSIVFHNPATGTTDRITGTGP
jgi:RES domain-containing protein